MSIIPVDSSFSLMSDMHFQQVQSVRRVGSDELPFLAPEKVEEKKSSSENSTRSYSSSSSSFGRSTDATGIEISEEMQNFLATLPDSEKQNIVSMGRAYDSSNAIYTDKALTKGNGTYSASAISSEISTENTAQGDIETAPILNAAGLLMSVNPSIQNEASVNAGQAMYANKMHTPLVQSTSAVPPTQGSESQQNQQQMNNNSFNSQQRRMNHAMTAYSQVQTRPFA